MPDIQISYNSSGSSYSFNRHSNYFNLHLYLLLPHPTTYITMLVKLIGVFLILYISIASATPTGNAPATNDNTQALVPRQPPTPPHVGPPYDVCPRNPRHVWEKRECLYIISPRTYRDICARLGIDYMWNGRLGRMRPFTRKATRYITRMCPENTLCMNRVENNYDIITCHPLYPPRFQWKGKGQANRDDDKRMTGESEPKSAGTDGDYQFKQTVTIGRNMPGSSTSAALISECRTVNVHVLIFLCSCRESIEFRY